MGCGVGVWCGGAVWGVVWGAGWVVVGEVVWVVFKQAVFSKDFSAKISKMMIPFLNLTV